jgi:hypothetical protein
MAAVATVVVAATAAVLAVVDSAVLGRQPATHVAASAT